MQRVNFERAVNRAAQQDPWDIIMGKKKKKTFKKKEVVWVTAKLYIDVFHPEDCEVFWGEYRVITVGENLLYCRVTPRFLGGSGSWQGSQTADSFTSTFEKDENQLLQSCAVTDSASDSTLHEAHYDINHSHSNIFCKISR